MLSYSMKIALASSTLALFAASAPKLSAAEEKKDTYFIQTQLGANQGFVSLGMGYRMDRWENSASLGYVPPYKSGAQITQANLKTNFRVLSGEGPEIQWLWGASLLVNASSRTFFEAPRKYPGKYYPPNAYYFALNTTIRHHGFFVEASLLDYFMEVAARNRNSFDYLKDGVSIGMGYNQDVDFEFSDISDAVGSWF